MKAIKTKYIGPTNTRGSRCKASDGDKHSITIPWDNSYDSVRMHEIAATAFIEKMKWPNRKFYTGWLEDSTMAHVFKE